MFFYVFFSTRRPLAYVTNISSVSVPNKTSKPGLAYRHKGIPTFIPILIQYSFNTQDFSIQINLTLKWTLEDLFNCKPKLGQVMAWCCLTLPQPILTKDSYDPSSGESI